MVLRYSPGAVLVSDLDNGSHMTELNTWISLVLTQELTEELL